MSPKAKVTKPKEPLILWWMPVLALLAPLVYAVWQGATAANGGFGGFATAIVWPGVALSAGALAVLWGGWKIDLE